MKKRGDFPAKLGIILFLLAGISISLIFIPQRIYTFEGFFFDTYVRGKFFSRNPFLAAKVKEKILKELRRINQLEVNGIKPGRIDSTTATLIKKMLPVSKKTGGYFDPTIDAVLKRWNYFKEKKVPDTEIIDSALKSVDYTKVNIQDNHLEMPPGYTITTGGSAKGYALNRIKKILNGNDIRSGMVEAGGDIVIVGKKPGEENWIIGIRHPRKKNEIIGKVELSDCFIVTSGDYERYFIFEGRRFHHIVDPGTGFPAEGIISATVIGKDGIKLDCLSTAIIAMGFEKGIKYIEENDIEALVVDSAEKIHNFIHDRGFKK